MNATLEGAIQEKVTKEFCGGTGATELDKLKVLKSNRYTMEGWPTGQAHQIRYVLGYWFPNEQPSDSPKVGMEIYVKPNLPAIAKAMHNFSEASKGTVRKWERWDYTGGDDWEGIGCTRKLEGFLAAEDHVAAIKTWFEELLDDAAAFRKQNPSLPWVARSAEGDKE